MTAPSPAAERRAELLRTVAIAVVATLVAGLLAVLAGTGSWAIGTVHGRLVLPGGAAAPGVAVEVYKHGVGGPALLDTPAAKTTTGSTGTFSIDLAGAPGGGDGTYTLRFGATTSTHAQFLGGYETAAEGQSFVFRSTGDNELRVALVAGGSFTGTVTNSAGKAAKGAKVSLYRLDRDGGWDLQRSAFTSSAGGYTLGGLAPGEYRLGFWDYLAKTAPVFSGGASTLSAATIHSLASGGRITVNQRLGKGSRVTGRVSGWLRNVDHTWVSPNTPAQSLAGVGGVRVVPHLLTGSVGAWTGSTPLHDLAATTATNGDYTLRGLPAGHYTLEFRTEAAGYQTGDIYPIGSPGWRSVAFSGGFLGADPSSPTTAPTSAILATAFAVDGAASYSGMHQTLAAVIGSISQTGEVNGSLSGSQALAPTVPVFVRRVGEPLPDEQPQPGDEYTVATGSLQVLGLGRGTFVITIGTDSPAYLGAIYTAPGASGTPYSTDVEPVSFTIAVNHSFHNVGACCGGSDLIPPLEPKVALANTVPPELIDADGGSVQVGDLLTADGSIWTKNPEQLGYQWLRDGRAIPGATAAGYTVGPGDLGAELSVRVIARHSKFSQASAVSNASGAVVLGDAPVPFVNPALVGSGRVGEWLTVQGLQDANWNVPGIAWSHFIWSCELREGGTESLPSTAVPRLLITPALRDRCLTISSGGGGTRPGYAAPWVSIDGILPLEYGQFTNTAKPKVTKSGSGYRVASPGRWSPAPSGYAYGWSTISASSLAVLGSGGGSGYTPAGTAADPVIVSVTPQLNGYIGSGHPVVVARPGTLPTTLSALAPAQAGVAASVTITGVPGIAPGESTGGSSSSVWQSYHPSSKKWLPIAGSTESFTGGGAPSWAPTGAYAGRQLRVQVTVRHPYFTTRTLTSNAVTVAGGAALGAPEQGGTVPLQQVHSGETVTEPGPFNTGVAVQAAALTWASAPGGVAPTLRYQWQSSMAGGELESAWANIPGATKRAYTPSGSFSYLRLRVTATVPGFAPWVGTSSSAEDEGAVGVRPALTDWTIPVISTPRVGQRVTITTLPTWNLAGTRVTGYQWLRWNTATPGWELIEGATASSYTPPASTPPGYRLGVRVTATNGTESQSSVSASSSAATVLQGVFTNRTAPKVRITGSTAALLGNGSWSPSPTEYSSEWRVLDRNGYPMASGTGSSFDFTGNESARIELVIRPRREIPGPVAGNYSHDSEHVFLVRAGSKPVPTTEPALTGLVGGSPRAGSAIGIVTAPGDWDVAGTTLSYQWKSGGKVVGRSTSFTPSAKQIGKALTVTITAKASGYATNALTLAAGAVLHVGDIASTAPPTISGPLQVGGVLRAKGGAWSIGKIALRYQWLADGEPITGATASSFTPRPEHFGRRISVQATATRSGYKAGSAVSAETLELGLGAAPAPSTPLRLSGTAAIGSTLSLSSGGWPAGTVVSVQWYRSIGDVAIEGANQWSYTTTADDGGSALYALVTATRAGHLDAEIESPRSAVLPIP